MIFVRQLGRVVSLSDSQSSGPRFESCSDHYLDSFLGSPKFKSLARLVQYCAKVMQTIIDEYRDNRDISAIFER